MTETNIITWAVATDLHGGPAVTPEPNQEECRSALALVRLNRAARRYSVETIGTADDALAARLAREAVAAFSGGADWTRVRPGDLISPVPAPTPEPAPERIDLGAVTPGHPAFAAAARDMLRLGGVDPDDTRADPKRAELGRALIERALAEAWSIRRLGNEILRAKADAADRTHVSALHGLDTRDPIALATGTAPIDHVTLWARVTRQPEAGEVTNATRRGF